MGRDAKLTLPDSAAALPGRETPIDCGECHFANGNPLHGPWPEGMRVALFAAGCFWGVEERYWRLPGVFSTAVGYAAGFTPNPTYEEVCTGLTGHAEAVLVIYDPAVVTYERLLKTFWECHDPTQGMRQGNDVGTQYRSAIYPLDDEQRAAAETSAAVYARTLADAGYGPLTTEIETAPGVEGFFYYAEEPHQQILAKHPDGYRCHAATGVAYPGRRTGRSAGNLESMRFHASTTAPCATLFLIVAVVVTVFAAVAVPPAGAVTIGADLNRPADAAYGCETMPGTDMWGGRFLYPTGQASCTYQLTSTNVAEVPQAQYPGGVLTSVSVKVGPTTGPMQATILRATRGDYGFQCCYHAGESQVFTPAANSVTTVPVRLPMRNDLLPNLGETVDYVGITVLAAGVPVPMQDLGNANNFPTQGAIGFFPHVKPGDVRVDGAGLGALVPLIAGEFSPFCAAKAAGAAGERTASFASALGFPDVRRTIASAPSPPARAAAGCVNAIEATTSRPRVSRNRAKIGLRCNLGFDCAGVLRLQSRSSGGRTYGSATVKLGANATAVARIKLKAAGRRLLRKRRRARIHLNATLTMPDGSKALVSSQVTLRR